MVLYSDKKTKNFTNHLINLSILNCDYSEIPTFMCKEFSADTLDVLCFFYSAKLGKVENSFTQF